MATGLDNHATAAPPLSAGAGEPSDDTLMVSYCAGDAAAFDALYARHRTAIYRFFLRQLPQAEAEECHQEVWLKLVNGRARYQGRGEFRSYLFAIAHNTLTDRHRRAMKHGVIDHEADADAIADGAPDPEAITAQGREAARLYRHLAALPVAQREALLMKESAGLSLAEIARITETSEEGVKSRIRYAMQKLRQAMNGGEVTGREVPGP
jgi:RNA polymerase sigma-70 factor, ECF subfamily